MIRGRAGWPSAVLLALLLAAGCSTSPDPGDYREHASSTLGTAVSEVATARIVLTELAEGDTFRPAALTQLRYGEESLGSAAQSFGSLNPPVRLQPVYDRSTSLLGDAEELLAAVRIAVHRGSTESYARLLEDLGRLASDLEQLEGRVRT